MSKELGYTPAPAGPGKDGYNTTGGGKTGGGETNAHRKSKARQDGVGQKDRVNAGDHLWNENGRVNGDPEDC